MCRIDEADQIECSRVVEKPIKNFIFTDRTAVLHHISTAQQKLRLVSTILCSRKDSIGRKRLPTSSMWRRLLSRCCQYASDRHNGTNRAGRHARQDAVDVRTRLLHPFADRATVQQQVTIASSCVLRRADDVKQPDLLARWSIATTGRLTDVFWLTNSFWPHGIAISP